MKRSESYRKREEGGGGKENEKKTGGSKKREEFLQLLVGELKYFVSLALEAKTTGNFVTAGRPPTVRRKNLAVTRRFFIVIGRKWYLF